MSESFAPFADLVNKHSGQPAIVMVGGVRLPDHYKAVPKRGAVKISVNQHGVKLTKCHYSVFLDYNQVGPQVSAIQGPHKRITHGKVHVDYRLTEFWHPGDSAMLATWVAYQMGCAPIIILGMDGYRDGTYWHDKDAKSHGKNITPSSHLRNWHREITKNIPNAESIIRAFDEPLNTIFPPYDKDETFEPGHINVPPPKPTPEAVEGPKIKMLRNVRLGPGPGNTAERGEVVEVGRATLSALSEGKDYVLYAAEESRPW